MKIKNRNYSSLLLFFKSLELDENSELIIEYYFSFISFSLIAISNSVLSFADSYLNA